jgi:phage I-like protein
MDIIQLRLTAKISGTGGDVPEWVLLFAEGPGELATGERFLVDRAGFDLMTAKLAARGVDIVWDYEHQTLSGNKAPAAGWIKALRYDDGVGVMAKVDWTEAATSHIRGREYRYFSPVFDVRKSDSRVVGLHSVALTNTPRTNNLQPIVAKQSADSADGGQTMLKKLIAKLGLPETATEEEVMAKIGELAAKKPGTVEVVAKDVIEALGLDANANVSTVVASIHAMNQATKTMVSKTEFDALSKKLLDRDVAEIVAKAMGEGKITPDQEEWARGYATKDMEGFKVFVAKAVPVIPMDKLPGKTKDTNTTVMDDTTVTIAASMGLSQEDLKKYA